MLRRLVTLLLILLAGPGAAAPGASPKPALPAAFVPPPILMYHRIDVDRPNDRIGRELTVTPDDFARELAYLRAQGISAISMEQLRERLENGTPLDHVVVLTFDDGYADQYDYAVPLLHEFGDTATFYIITGAIDTPRHVTWAQLRLMRSLGQDIAAHGVRHDDLSRMTGAQQAYQIDESVALLRSRLAVPARSYCYPSGRFNRETLTLVQGAGVDLAVTTDASYVIAPENRFELPRIRVLADWTLADFASAIRAALIRSQIVRG